MSKKKLFVMTALVVILAIIGTGTLAYFTTKAVVHNVITTGGIHIDLVENFPGSVDDADGNKVLEGVMPGQSPDKEVWVENLKNSADAWIRVGVKITVTDSQGRDLTAQAMAKNVVNIPTYGTDWTPGEEENGIRWYYYEKLVVPGEATSNLFEKVTFNGPNMGNEYQNATITVEVNAQAVQAANNPIPDGGNVTDIKGWPNT